MDGDCEINDGDIKQNIQLIIRVLYAQEAVERLVTIKKWSPSENLSYEDVFLSGKHRNILYI
jgi:hypothetical protein